MVNHESGPQGSVTTRVNPCRFLRHNFVSRSEPEITTYYDITYKQMKVNISVELVTRPASL